jgi:hypothetical protein
MITLILIFLLLIAIIAVVTYMICFGIGAWAIVIVVIGILSVVGLSVKWITDLIKKKKSAKQ